MVKYGLTATTGLVISLQLVIMWWSDRRPTTTTPAMKLSASELLTVHPSQPLQTVKVMEGADNSRHADVPGDNGDMYKISAGDDDDGNDDDDDAEADRSAENDALSGDVKLHQHRLSIRQMMMMAMMMMMMMMMMVVVVVVVIICHVITVRRWLPV